MINLSQHLWFQSSNRKGKKRPEFFFNFDNFIDEIKDTLNGQKFKKKSGKSRQNRIKDFFNINSPQDFEKLVSNEEILSPNPTEKINLQNFLESGKYLNLNQERTFLYKIFNIREIIKYYCLITTCSLNGVEIPYLSMGERSTLYLKLKLATSEFTRPIIIDQPEDDLDNDYIQNELVPLLKMLKNYRQIIMATHNANLVVNAIAEQIIIASNTGEEISFKSDSVVKEEIRVVICNILEGGEDAFRSRAKKYNINIHPKID
jgi:putative AbiEii toxin of type IV toxin-antitoxin system